LFVHFSSLPDFSDFGHRQIGKTDTNSDTIVSPDTFHYLPSPSEPSAWNVEIHGAGQSEIQAHERYPSQAHPATYQLDWQKGRTLPGFQALYITRGVGIIETEKTPERVIKAPILFLLFPNTWHRYQPNPETGWHERWIGFDGPLPRQLLASGTIGPEQPFFEIGHHERILDSFQLVLDEVTNEALGFRRIAAASVLQILALATSLPMRTEEENQPMRTTVRRACFLLRERTDSVVSIESIADDLKVGYTYFRRMFKRYTGFSPKQYHTQLRFERVKRLLRESDLSIGEIASLLNFDSPFHLSQWFKKLAGTPPTAWRQQKPKPGTQ